MLDQRLARLQSILQARDVNCLALIPGVNLLYMTGLHFHLIERAVIGLFPQEGPPVFVLPTLEQSRLERHVPYPTQVFTYADGEDPNDAVRDAFLALPEIRTIAVEYLRMRVHEFNLIRRRVPAAQFVNADPLMDSLRLVKTPQEIEHLRAAASISQQALQQIIAHVRPGMTERQIANRLAIAQLELGGGAAPFEALVQAGENAADPHGTLSDRVVKSGEVLLIDFGTTSAGYASDITRTFFVGEPPDERTRQVYQAVRAANKAARTAAGPGVPCCDVDRAARAAIEEAGFGPQFIHRVGHGLGLDVHESPSVDHNNHTLLEPGNVITIEPGIYLPGQFGIRIEDDVLITADGSQSLSTFTRDFLVIGNT